MTFIKIKGCSKVSVSILKEYITLWREGPRYHYRDILCIVDTLPPQVKHTLAKITNFANDPVIT